MRQGYVRHDIDCTPTAAHVFRRRQLDCGPTLAYRRVQGCALPRMKEYWIRNHIRRVYTGYRYATADDYGIQYTGPNTTACAYGIQYTGPYTTDGVYGIQYTGPYTADGIYGI